jgi:hypothetical protein
MRVVLAFWEHALVKRRTADRSRRDRSALVSTSLSERERHRRSGPEPLNRSRLVAAPLANACTFVCTLPRHRHPRVEAQPRTAVGRFDDLGRVAGTGRAHANALGLLERPRAPQVR